MAANQPPQPPPPTGYPPQYQPAPPPLGQPQYAPAPSPKKSRKTLYIVVVVVVAVALIAVAVLAALPRAPAPTTLESAGSVHQVPPSSAWDESFTLSASATITGSFNVSGGAVTAYLMTPSTYASYIATGNLTTYTWTSGSVSSGSVDVVTSSGSWDLAFVNLGSRTVSLEFTSALVASPV